MAGMTVLSPVRAAKKWRDEELQATDWIYFAPEDHKNRDAILAYRQALRDWPEHEGFPDIRPVLGA
jgi:hypothetical protein